MTSIGNAYNSIRDHAMSTSPLERGVTAGAVLGGGAGVGTLAWHGFKWMRHGKVAGNPLQTSLRAAVTGAVGFGALGALSNVRLSNDRYVAGVQGAGLGFAVGSLGTAAIGAVWSTGAGHTLKHLAGAALIGGAIAGAVYGALGLSGAVAHKE